MHAHVQKSTSLQGTEVSFFSGRLGRVLVVGDIILDRFLWSECARISPEAPVPIARVTKESSSLGGAANVAANIAALGGVALLASVTGDEASALPALALLDKAKIDRSGVLCETGRRLTRKSRILAQQQQVLRFDEEDTFWATESSQGRLLAYVETALASVDTVVLSDYGKGTLAPALVTRLIQLARAADRPVVVDPNGADWSKYAGATLLTPNRKQALEATGIDGSTMERVREAGAAIIQRFGVKSALITLSENGAALVQPDDYRHFPAAALEVRDVTGAGDTVVAALALGLARGATLFESCRIANACAGIAVGKLGTAVVTAPELAEALHTTHGPRSSALPIALEELQQVRRHLRATGRKLVFTNGCFDILHAGHVRCLEEAASYGDVLVVALNTDDSIRRQKGESRPINALQDRCRVLTALKAVDYVIAFSDDTPLQLIEALQPDVLVKGADYAPDEIVGAVQVRASGGAVRTVPLVPRQSTTRIANLLERD